MYEITKTLQAKDDLKGIWHFSRDKWGEDKATEYLLQLETGINQLTSNPKLGKGRENIRPGYRSIQINRHVIYYRISEENINIVRVLHERMIPAKYL